MHLLDKTVFTDKYEPVPIYINFLRTLHIFKVNTTKYQLYSYEYGLTYEYILNINAFAWGNN